MTTTGITQNEILAKYNKLPSTKQVPILYEALNYMQQYNGRSRADCVCLAMGYQYEISTDDYSKSE